MEFSDYNGPFTAELQEAWNGLTEDQQTELQMNADAAHAGYVMSLFFGDEDSALQIAEDVLAEAHRIAGLPIPGQALVRDAETGLPVDLATGESPE